MSTLILASSWENIFSKELKSFLGKNFEEYKIAYITTASNVIEDKSYIQFYLDNMKDLWLNATAIDISEYSKKNLEQELSKYSMIYVEWWNTFYLLEQAIKSGFIEVIPKLVSKWVVYIWVSAGTYLACPWIEMATNSDNNKYWITDYTALNLINFYIEAHYLSWERKNENLQKMAKLLNKKIYALKDSQIVIVKDWKISILGGEVKEF